MIKERPQDAEAIRALINQSFGAERHKLTVYTLRSGCPPVGDLSYIAIDEQGVMQGSIRFWPVRIGKTGLRAVLLGPLAVAPDRQGHGVGKSLIKRGLEEATHLGFGLCLVVGDQRLYTHFAFTNASMLGFKLPGPVDPARFQVKELAKGCLNRQDDNRLVLPFRP